LEHRSPKAAVVVPVAEPAAEQVVAPEPEPELAGPAVPRERVARQEAPPLVVVAR